MKLARGSGMIDYEFAVACYQEQRRASVTPARPHSILDLSAESIKLTHTGSVFRRNLALGSLPECYYRDQQPSGEAMHFGYWTGRQPNC